MESSTTFEFLIPMTANDVLQKACEEDDQSHLKLCGTLAYIIGCPKEIVSQISNLDCIRFPVCEELGNWIQYATQEEDNVNTILWALTNNLDYEWGEPYNFEANLLKLKRVFLMTVKEIGVKEYIKQVEERAWKKEGWLKDYEEIFDKALIKYKI